MKKISKLGIGAAQFGLNYGVSNSSGIVSDTEVRSILIRAKSLGIDTIDTAMNYGKSEKVLGGIGVSEFNIITKLSSFSDEITNVSGWVETQIHDSLRKLNINRLYAVLIHNKSDLAGVKGIKIVEALENLKKNNIIQKLGVSIYEPHELNIATRLMDLDIVQAPYNLIDRSLETSGWLNSLHKNGVIVHTRSAFLQGLLLMDVNELPKKFMKWAGIWKSFRDQLKNLDLSPLDACLGFVMSKPQIDRVIVGVQNQKQLNQLRLTRSEFNESFQNIISHDSDLINPTNWKFL